MNRVLCLAGMMALLVTRVFAAPQSADLIVTHARIWTGDAHHPEAEALAVVGSRLVAVGTNVAVLSLSGPKTRVLDLAGRRVLPGFYDSHVHLLDAGMSLSQINLKETRNEAEFGALMRAYDAKLPPGDWMTGGEWDHDRTFNGVLPDAALLDRYVPNRPVYLTRYDGHIAVVNTRALKLAGVSRLTPDPEGGVIRRKPGSLEPTGVLGDAARRLVTRYIPDPSPAVVATAIRNAVAAATRAGVTSVQDMAGGGLQNRARLLHLYQDMARTGELTLRIDLRWPLSGWAAAADFVKNGVGGDWVRIGGVKGFADGSLGASTAKFFEPYVNQPHNTGVFTNPLAEMEKDILAADAASLSVAIHAIGDRANAQVLDIFAKVEATNPPWDRRLRIEHAQHLRPEDIGRFAKLGVVASLQPYHASDDGRFAEGRIGKVRCASSYASGSLLAAGAKVAYGTDWEVAPISPLLSIDAAVHRRTLDGKNPDGWFPAQKISVAQAIAAYTLTSAYAGHEEKDRGSLEPGKLADFVVLSRDILAPTESENIAATAVVQTVVGGRVVYSNGDVR